jgi:hypothetical protein
MWSDLQALRNSSFTNLSRPLCSAHDFGYAPLGALDSNHATHDPDVHDFGRATCPSDIPAPPATLLVSPLGYVGATGTTSTSTVAASKGCTGGTSSQPSSDDHVGKAGFLTSDRQTHPVIHLGVHLVVGALLSPHRPHRSKLASRHGRRVCYLDRQQHLGSCPLPRWL